MKIKSKYQIWDDGILCPAWTRKPKNPMARPLGVRTIEEAKLGIRYYIPKQRLVD